MQYWKKWNFKEKKRGEETVADGGLKKKVFGALFYTNLFETKSKTSTIKTIKRLTSGLSGAMSSGNLASYIEEADNFRRESYRAFLQKKVFCCSKITC